MNVEAWGPAGVLPMAALPDKPSTHVDVSGKQVVIENAGAVAAFSPAFQPDAFQTVSHSFHLSAHLPESERQEMATYPDGDPRGIDGVPDWDSMRSLDDAPEQTLRAPHLASTSRIYPPRVIVDYRRPSHVELVRRMDGLEAKLNQIPLMMGHNGPPSAIEEQQRQIAVLVAGILHETEKLKRQDPQPVAAQEAKAAATKLEAYKVALIAVGGSIAGGVGGAIGERLVDYCEKHLPEAIAQLQAVIAQLWVWIEAIEQFARAARN